MQTYAETIREDVWGKLNKIFLEATGGKNAILSNEIKGVLINTLKITDQHEIDYVLKNLFRLDTDNNGNIDFPEFANFLLKRHCGELALQRRHKKEGGIKHAAERKLTSEEFAELLNDSYSFLGVKVDPADVNAIFKEQIKGTDGLMTYVEYFSFVERWICKSKEVLAAPPKPTKDYVSRLRTFSWEFLRVIFNQYDKNKNGKLEQQEIELLIREVLHQTSASQIEFVLTSIFHMESADSAIDFTTFCVNYLRYYCDLCLARWSLQHPHGQRRLQLKDFLILNQNGTAYCNGHRISENLFKLFFDKIDTDHDGWISFAEYAHCTRTFLAVPVYNGLEFYIEEDDMGLDKGDGIIASGISQVPATPVVSGVICPYKFSNHDLARRVRAHLFVLLEKYDLNKNLTFEENEIINILKTLLKSDDFDIFYVIANVFRYDVDGDRRVTYDELTNFFLELHAGELAIQRLHRVGSYVRGAQLQLNLADFIKTLTYAFSFVEFTAAEDELKVLFSEIDLDHDGWISYKEYFEFLKFYFGSLSLVYQEKDNKPHVEPVDPYGKLSPEDRFARITIDQLLLILKHYRFQPFTKIELNRFLYDIFRLTQEEVDFGASRFFRYDLISGGYFLDTDVARILLEVYFAELILVRLHRAKKFARCDENLIGLEDFLLIIDIATAWLKTKHDKGLLETVFKIIDTNGDGFISYKEFMAFIRKYFGGRISIEDFKDPFDGKTEPTEEEFYGHIWSELREIYKHYTKGKFLNKEELRVLINEVLKEYKKSDMEYIFLNMFRVDPNKDSNIEFEEFAPFILKHAGEIGLRNFHLYQEPGKKTLDETEFKLVVGNAFGFLKSFNKSEKVLHSLFIRLANGRGFVTYTEYVGWVFASVASKVR